MSLSPGTAVGDLQILKRIGEGSHAAIYRVSMPDGQSGALKVLHTTEEAAVQRLLREGKALEGLRHPNIVRCHRAMEVQGRPALLMEFVAGPTLGDWMDAGGASSLEEALELFRGIARGVQAIHAAGLVHRDLNPGNVLLSVGSAKRVVPKIADFGLVTALTGSSLTQAGPLGTPAYMAPEQINDARNAGPASDRFSLGCILYEMVCGERAFQATGTFALFEAATKGDYLHPTKVRPELPDYVADVITTLLSAVPEERFDSIESLLEVLYLDDVPEITADEELPEVRQRWSEVRVSTSTAAKVRSMVPGQTPAPAADRQATPGLPSWLPWALVAVLGLVSGLLAALLLFG
jgi:serine/threonine-protein kinase